MSGRRDGGPADAGFLGRWSERKLKSRAEPDHDAEAAATEVAAETEPTKDAEPKTEAEILEELGLPDPETLGKGDDFSGFMKAAVPAALRSRALRRLWLTDPVLANLDGLVEYGQDFTDAATVVPNLKTAYKVGRGLLRDAPEQQDDPVETPAAAGLDGATGGQSGEVAARRSDEEVVAGEEVEDQAACAPAFGAGADAPESDQEAGEERVAGPPVSGAQRMRFQFEG